MKNRKIPTYLKWAYTLFMIILVPTYWIHYGPTNFLWFSDITLLFGYLAVMTEKSFFASMAAVGGLALELLWIIDFLFILFSDIHMTGLSDYMFDNSLSISLRAISLFHIVLPPLLIWLIIRLGYNRQAWPLQTVLGWIIIAATWLLTKPSENINFVFSYEKSKWLAMQPLLYLTLEAIVVAIVYAVTHGILIFITQHRRLFRK